MNTPTRPVIERTNKLGRRARLAGALALAAAAVLGGCTSGGGGGEPFGLTFISVQQGQVWKINRPIRIGFSSAVDFSSVNLNTINIRRMGGAPSAGEFFMESPNVVVFQPRCPLLDDYSDAGLLPGGIDYELSVLGIDKTSSLTVRSVGGVSLATGDSRTFKTPDSAQKPDLFFDPVPQAPSPVVRTTNPADNAILNATYVEIGGDPNDRVYFERDPLSGMISLDPPGALPLNKLSDPGTSVAMVVFFNQPVDPSVNNVTSTRLDWQFKNQNTLWQSLSTNVSLIANCAQSGAVVRIEPLGIMPPATELRLNVAPEFSDIVGETNLLFQNDFALADTDVAPDPLVDNMLEEFASTADSDTSAALADPFAEWGGGSLRHNFSFTGTGGNAAGNFNWTVPTGGATFFSTNSSTITDQFGATKTVIGGVVDVNDLTIPAGAVLKVTGSNPLVILASGTVTIEGEINISGSDNPGVVTLNTTNIPESGAPGQAGGGSGGIGSPLITASSPRGGNGSGAFNQPDAGGKGGETGWNNIAANQTDGRRGAGGGGGRLGPDQPQVFGTVASLGEFDQSFIGLDAEPGFSNLEPNANGAFSGPAGPFGGDVGPGPFVDADPTNDFFGVGVDFASNTIIPGELKTPWAGAGGGAGGDAAFVNINGTFPKTPFSPKGDEKGAGGGGGGGSLRILALEDIIIGANGLIVCRGGTGGGGENTLFLNRVGGGSGGGSGGHVILEAAGVIDMSAATGAGTSGQLAGGILATGGNGGAGKSDAGGATAGPNGQVEELPKNDACPPTTSTSGEYPTTGVNACQGHTDGAGGDGGPGLIQLHAPSVTSILPPAGKTLADVCKPNPRFFEVSTSPSWIAELTPSFSSRSVGRSQWIPLGEGGFDINGASYKNVTLEFGGTDPGTGLVKAPGGVVERLTAVLGPDTLLASGVPSILSAFRIVLDAGPLVGGANEFLLDSPALLNRYVLRLDNGSSVESFDVVAASYNPTTMALTLTVDGTGNDLTSSFGPGSTAELLPAFFRVSSNGVVDSLPDSATVTIQFQITTADAFGDPDLGNIFPDPMDPSVFESNVANINSAPGNEDFRFFRFETLFNIDALGNGLTPTNPIPSIDFLRVPFRYQ